MKIKYLFKSSASKITNIYNNDELIFQKNLFDKILINCLIKFSLQKKLT